MLINGYVFEFMEYIQGEKRLKYRFHLVDVDGNLLFRYDNAKHHPELKGYPHHLHLPDRIESSKETSFPEVFKEVMRSVLHS